VSKNLKFPGLVAMMAFDNWPMLFLSRVFDRKTGFVAYRKNGMDILVDHVGGDENGTRMCIATDMYKKYLPTFVLPGAVNILDLGANGGGFPLMVRLAGIEVARVVSVEMNPLTFLRLQLNLTTNLRSSAIVINAAVCGMPENSEILLNPSRGSTGESMYSDRTGSRDGSNGSNIAVRTTTMQTLFDQYFKNQFVDICKIDIEGAEYEVFASSPDDVLQRIRYLIVEFHDAPKTPEVLKRIAGLGFIETTIGEKKSTSDTTEVRVFAGPHAGSHPDKTKSLSS
jgi:FkbM family methyltransferase